MERSVSAVRTLDQVTNPRRARDDEATFWAAGEGAGSYGLHRSPFETDGDKITFCEGFRALADKTQVHDRVQVQGTHRNRLTHSVEVSRVGRSLGVSVGARMISYYGLHAAPAGEAFWRADPADIGHIVSAACLAHDLGNPPFGHDGETAISNFFTKSETGKRACALVSESVADELRCHEGNAQGFRMVTRSMGWRGEGGLNLTAATLAAFGKYPHPWRAGSPKYGVHQADMETLHDIAVMTGMIPDPKGGFLRHPLAWLMEAADDICYLTVDLEDAALLGIIPIERLFELFGQILGEEQISAARALGCNHRAIQMLRSRVIKALINGCVEVYASIADQLDDGSLGAKGGKSGIVGLSRHGDAIEAIRQFSIAEIYRSETTRGLRARYATAMKNALGLLVEELLDVIQGEGRIRPDRHEALAQLSAARLDPVVPCEPDLALPWLMDQVTLLSDRQILELGEGPQS